MKERYLLTAGGVDRKGIVFNLTGLLKNHNFNIEDSSMVMLRRTFSVIMLLSNEKGRKKDFDKELKEFMAKNRMNVHLEKVAEREMAEYPGRGNTFMISISGADKPGIVNEMSGVIYRLGGNITGLETKSSEKTRPHAYYMFLEVDMPKKTGMKSLEKAFKDKGKKAGVHVSVNRVEKEIL